MSNIFEIPKDQDTNANSDTNIDSNSNTPMPNIVEYSDEITLPEIKERVNEKGQIEKYRVVDGLEVVLSATQNIKDKFKHALWRAALMNEDEIKYALDDPKKTALEKSAIMLSNLAANGKMEAITQLFDRVMGKPKQTVENRNLNLTIDDVLAEAIPEEEDSDG